MKVKWIEPQPAPLYMDLAKEIEKTIDMNVPDNIDDYNIYPRMQFTSTPGDPNAQIVYITLMFRRTLIYNENEADKTIHTSVYVYGSCMDSSPSEYIKAICEKVKYNLINLVVQIMYHSKTGEFQLTKDGGIAYVV